MYVHGQLRDGVPPLASMLALFSKWRSVKDELLPLKTHFRFGGQVSKNLRRAELNIGASLANKRMDFLPL